MKYKYYKIVKSADPKDGLYNIVVKLVRIFGDSADVMPAIGGSWTPDVRDKAYFACKGLGPLADNCLSIEQTEAKSIEKRFVRQNELVSV
jgi:hypothetical protein